MQKSGSRYFFLIISLFLGYYLSQILLSLFMGQIVEATGRQDLYILTAAICALTSAYFARGVAFSKEDGSRTLLKEPAKAALVKA